MTSTERVTLDYRFCPFGVWFCVGMFIFDQPLTCSSLRKTPPSLVEINRPCGTPGSSRRFVHAARGFGPLGFRCLPPGATYYSGALGTRGCTPGLLTNITVSANLAKRNRHAKCRHFGRVPACAKAIVCVAS